MVTARRCYMSFTCRRGTFLTDHLMGSDGSSSPSHNPLDKDVSEVILFGLETSFLEGMKVLTVNHNRYILYL
jgi:hypothetical protein